MPKYGTKDVFLLVDGYDLAPSKVAEVRRKIMAEIEEVTGIGDAWREHSPTGVKSAELAFARAFFDTAAGNAHAALSGSIASDPNAAGRIVVFGFAGETIGEPFDGFEGAYQQDYGVISSRGELTKADAAHMVSGQHDEGKILHAHGVETAASGNTEGSSVDNAASSANGGAGYAEVSALTLGGYDDVVLKVRHSADDIAYADLVTFTAVTAAPAAERKTVAGTVNRYTACSWQFGGTGSGQSVKFFVGFARG